MKGQGAVSASGGALVGDRMVILEDFSSMLCEFIFFYFAILQSYGFENPSAVDSPKCPTPFPSILRQQIQHFFRYWRIQGVLK